MDLTAINAGDLGFQKSFDIIIMVVLGGMGSISGAALAAVVMTLLPEFLRSLWQPLQEFRLIIFAFLLILMMILRPQGLFGVHEIWEMGPFRKLRRGSKPSSTSDAPTGGGAS
jgi:branched-chain amino acid transport system permease protein